MPFKTSLNLIGCQKKKKKRETKIHLCLDTRITAEHVGGNMMAAAFIPHFTSIAIYPRVGTMHRSRSTLCDNTL